MSTDRISHALRYGFDHLNLAGLGLKDADLEGNADFTALAPQLRYLDLTSNALTKLPAALHQAKGLIWLGLNFNQLTTVEGVEDCTTLQRLYLRGNQLRELPEMMGNLQALLELDLMGNRITRLPSSMGHLVGLEYVELEGEELDPEQRAAWEEGGWKALAKLLEPLTLWIALAERMRRLTGRISVATNAVDITSEPQRLREASSAVSALLPESAKLREDVFQALADYRDLDPAMHEKIRHAVQRIEDGALQKGLASLEEFMAALAQLAALIDERVESGKRHIFKHDLTTHAAKLILVGERNQGKTCLQRALRGQPTKAGNESTEGMNRERLCLGKDGALLKDCPAHPSPEVLDFSLWDMGGQDDYWHMHQLLFTRQAIYLVVLKAREGDLDKWLRLIQRRTEGEAKVFVVFTHGTADASFTLESLRKTYDQLDIRGLHVVNTVAEPEKGRAEICGLDELRRALAALVQEEHSPFTHQWRSGWTEALHELQAMGRGGTPYLRWEEEDEEKESIVKLCVRHQIPVEDQRLVMRVGHLIGALLWRNDIPEGDKVVVLRPDWLNRAVARVVDAKETRDRRGMMPVEVLEKLWLQESRDGVEGIAANTHRMLIELMEINELAYRPKKDGKPEEGLLLFTQRVEDRTAAEVEAEWEKHSPKSYLEARQIIAFAPKDGTLGFGEVQNLVYLLIFRLRAYGMGRRNHSEAVHWQQGLLVSDDYGSVARVELRDRELHLTLRYVRTDHLFYRINEQIGGDEDHAWNGLVKRQFVLCGDACPRLLTDEMKGRGRVSVTACYKALAKGRTEVSCGSGGACDEEIEIAKVLPASRTLESEAVREAKLERDVKTLLAGQQQLLEGQAELRRHISETARMHAEELIAAIGGAGDVEPRLFSLKPVEKDWWQPSRYTDIEFDLTVWCEWTLMPVPFFGDERGTQRVSLPRPWVGQMKKVLKFTTWALRAWKTGGLLAGNIGGESSDWTSSDAQKKWLDDAIKSAAEMEKALKDAPDDALAEATMSDTGQQHPGVHYLASRGYGDPNAIERGFVDTLRHKFHEKAHGWAGLVEHWEDGRWFMRHPMWEAFGRNALSRSAEP